MTDIELARKFSSLSQSVKTRGKPFNLTLRHFKKLITTTKCFYTGKEFTKDGPLQRTIDCMDPDKGYIDNNTVVCCRYINSHKANLTPLEIKLIYLALKRREII